MVERRHAWLIVNPTAGRKMGLLRGTISPDDIRSVLEQHGIVSEMRLTESASHATELAREAVAAGVDLVIAAGGDGTVHEVACGLICSPTTLGILPVGSMMNIARTLHIPYDLNKAAEVISDGRVARMDVGKAITRTGEAHFLEMAGIGVDAGIFAYTNQLESGNWKSARKLLRFLMRYAPQRVRVTVDGKTEVVRAFMITVAVGPFTGLAFALAPDAKIDDREFDVVIREKFTRFEFIRHGISILGGRRAYHPKARMLKARRVEVEPMDRKPMVHADGRNLGTVPASFEVLPAALSIIVGEPSPGEASPITAPELPLP